ncbi:prolipoprotein diacylglyceryl transferase [Sporolactobacillus sp. Y61]|jgi:phosphatidylglycerol:prolipoprotein diacylglycerol transferase|uniref:Phosphatidylglycerol--prolipoprotein diacylglyceryl transferase n=1 Tax=Sporolactobacillus sp. Y61 TaxID=3160863 RepID=A0AAU8IBX2_9BACL|nr:prolipoprotein diacylglyceryl transferase [Sporolactobacillus sp. THM19-2]RYL93634.1 prolipoprotein diacylglyceryl transferase [Sporolactobacillus sp. THM19-2]
MDQNIEPLDRVAIQLGPIHIYWYGIIIAAAALIGLLLAIREGRKRGLPQDTYVDLILFAAPISIIFARLYYVIFEWSYYSKHPMEIFAIWNGGIAIYGSLIGAVGTAIVFCAVRRLPFWKVADIAAPSVILGQAIGRWGNFINQEAHGAETTREALENLHLPDFIINQMLINGSYYVPTFLYESVWDFLVFIVLLILRRVNLKRGEVFVSYMMLYAAGRAWIEGLRTDSLMFGTLRVSQWLSVVLIIIGIGLILYWRIFDKKRPRYLD